MASFSKRVPAATLASILALMAALFQHSPAGAADPTDAWDQLTGVSTARSEALDKQAADLATEYVKLQARRSVSTDRNEQIEIYERSPQILGQTRQDALGAAKARAHAVVAIGNAISARYPEAKYGCCEVGTGIATISMAYRTDESKEIPEGAAPRSRILRIPMKCRIELKPAGRPQAHPSYVWPAVHRLSFCAE